MDDWLEVPAEEFCESVRDGTHDSPKPVEDGRYLITSRHIIGSRIDLSNAYQISQSDFDEVNRRSKVDRWDVLITMIGTVGDVCLVREEPDFAIKNIGLFKTKGEENGKWLYYYMKSPLSKILIESQKRGTTQAYIPLRDLRSFPIRYPKDKCLAESITSLLSSIDDKIDLNRRMNETLEAMARTIFKDWFVDFGPTRAKAEGLEPHLVPELWELFPDALDDEGKPLGWDQGTLADVAESPRRGVSLADVSEDTPYIGLEHMPRRSIALSEWEGAGKVKSNKNQFHRGEILFGKLRPYFHKVGIAPVDGICSTDIVVVVPRETQWEAFTLACLSSNEFVDYTDQTSTGTKMPRTNWKTMAQYKICLASKQVVHAFQSIVRPLLDLVGANIHESRTLARTRDLLLPKLMSGEMRLPDVERVVKAVA